MTGSKLLYASAIMDLAGKEAEKEKILSANLVDLIDTDVKTKYYLFLDCILQIFLKFHLIFFIFTKKKQADYVDFIFAFTNFKGEKVKQTPLVRVKF